MKIVIRKKYASFIEWFYKENYLMELSILKTVHNQKMMENVILIFQKEKNIIEKYKDVLGSYYLGISFFKK